MPVTSRDLLTIRIDALEGSPYAHPRWEAPPLLTYCEEIHSLRQDLAKRLKVRLTPQDDFEINLDLPQAKELLDILKRLRAEKAADVGMASFRREVIPEDAEWVEARFQLENDYGPWGMEDGFPLINAACLSSRVHMFGRRQLYVSEQFVDVVRRHQLSGVEFLRIKDIGQYQARAWYWAFPTRWMGLKLHNPWIDLPRYQGTQTDLSPWRNGFGACPREFLREPCPFGDPVKDDLLNFPLDERLNFGNKAVFVAGPSRILRSNLPETDFGFLAEASNRDHYRYFWSLCMNRRAYASLTAAGVLDPEWCTGLLVCDTGGPTVTSEQLQGVHGELAAEYHALKPREEEVIASMRTKPAAPLTVKSVLEKLGKKPRKISRKNFKWADVESRINIRVPEDWKIAAPLFESPGNYLFESTQRMVEFHQQCEQTVVENAPEYQGKLIYVVDTEDGNCYALDMTEPQSPRVLYWNHECIAFTKQWDSIAAFVTEHHLVQ